MKAAVALSSVVALFAVVAPALAVEPTPQQVEEGVARAFVFAVTPDEEGRASSCSYVGAEDILEGDSEAPVSPSPAFIQNACDETMAKFANWVPLADGAGGYRAVNETCFWSEAIPEVAICRAALSFAFADEIPNGVGNLVILELRANTRGELVSCGSPEMMNLSTGEPLSAGPHALYVADACRKLGSVHWSGSADGPEFYSACRHVDEIPVRAFCERQFGL